MGRKHAREVALQALFASNMTGESIERTSDFALSESPLDETDKRFMEILVNGVSNNIGRFDGLIASYAKDWRLDRINAVDKCILRLAMYELSGGTDAPAQVVINEAVELAKKFSTEHSYQFINGILGRIVSGDDL